MNYTDNHYNTHQLGGLIHHSGVLTERDFELCLQDREVTVDGEIATPEVSVTRGSRVAIRGKGFSVIDGGGNERLQLIGDSDFGNAPGADVFYADCANQTIASISGHRLDLDRFEDIAVVRFIRDPRDLLVSGYFYHKRGAEHWCALENATDIDWKMVNGAVPDALPANTSLTAYLNQVPLEQGLLAELDFRRFHYESMLAWPDADPRVKLYCYEDIPGRCALQQ